MSPSEYDDELRNTIAQIQRKELDGVRRKLQEMYRYKPVRLLWHVANARLLFAEGKADEALNAVSAYIWPGIDCSGVDEFMKLHMDIVDTDGKKILEYRYGGIEERQETESHLDKVFAQYCKRMNHDTLIELMQAYCYAEQRVVYLILLMYLVKQGRFKAVDKGNWVFNETNNGYLYLKLFNENSNVLLVSSEDNQKENDLLAYLLHSMGHNVYILDLPNMFEDVDAHIDEVTQICVDNICQYEDSVVVPTVKSVDKGGNITDNRAEMIKYIYENCFENNFGIILATGDMFYKLTNTQLIKQHIECLSEYDHITLSDRVYFGWVGDYTKYISDLYGFDVRNRIEEECNCDFSIVVPARNSAGTLYYTLQTCLNQDYEGTYEIIVSDNSTNDRQEVYQVCKDLNDSRIKYVKTPRDLSLPKSFEFAFLQAHGEFIFSVGSDDGVCPWALSVMKKFLDEHPDDEVLQWKRGYYVWKDYPGTKENELVIPGQFKEGEYNSYYKPQLDYFAEVFKYSFNMYGLPTMYVNSGFRRSYFKTLLDKTGRLWDGCNQDLYMGIISAAICPKILNIEFPLTITGISSNSLGYVMSTQGTENRLSDKEKDIRTSATKGSNVGIYVLNGIAKEMPIGRGENFSLYANILRAIQLGVLPDEWRRTLFDHKKIYTEFFEEHICIDDEYDKYIHYARYQAGKLGEEFLKWFDETIYEPGITPKYYKKKDGPVEKIKSYKEGISSEGELVLDALRYGVTNIAEAVKLFERFIYWTPENWDKL